MKMKEPPMGSVVIDKSGSAWQRHPVGWSISGSDMSWSHTWRQLQESLYTTLNESPSQEWRPAMGDPRLPFIVYVPHEELFVEEEDEE